MSPIDVFQEQVQQATRRFVAEVVAAARCAVHAIAEAAINEAANEALGRTSYARAVQPVPAFPASGPGARAPRGHRTSPRDPATNELVLAAVRANPGCTTAQLRQALSIRTPSLLRQLRQLTRDGALRVEQRENAFSGQPCKVYFVVEPATPEPYVNGQAVTGAAVAEVLE